MTLRRSAAVHVCALSHVDRVARQIGAGHLVSAITADLQPATPPSISADRHLKLDMHDITEAQPGAVEPCADHVVQLLDFVRTWDREAPLLIHCHAGLSRSTAAAFITLCALNPHASESAIARAIRQSSDTAIPNRLFVSLADAALGREGRMLSALRSMGPNRVALECVPFGVAAHHASVASGDRNRAA